MCFLISMVVFILHNVFTDGDELSEDASVHFTEEECRRFTTRVEEGYDIPPTGRYALWLQRYHSGIYPLLLCYSVLLLTVK